MSWQDEMIPMVQTLIGDTTVYSSGRLQTAICISAKFVNTQYFNTYTITNSSISPDPTIAPDNWFVNLTVLKTACNLGNAESRVAAGQGISIKDGPSALDLKGISQYKANSAKTFCQQYDEAVKQYLTNSDAAFSALQAITGPIDYTYYPWRRRT